ncbi:MAG: fibronectin type III domain-containing protein, partial [Lachnospiraceae bacterium]|nr:fibronectin type III domain-containing protein [Lachnospiraceae bacterium]
DEDGNETNHKYFYYNIWRGNVFYPGNQLIVTLKDNTKKIYECVYNEKEQEWDFYTSDGEKLTGWDCYDDQYGNHWFEGSENEITIEYMGKTCKVPVKIIDNNVEGIAFESEEPIELYENTDGEWVTREDAEGSDKYFAYDFLLEKEGNKLTIKFKNGTEKVYVYNDDKAGFYTKDGEKLYDADWEWDDKQYENPYEPGINYCYIYYKGIEGKIKILVKHVFEETDNTATCTEKGEATYVCKVCGEKEVMPSDPTGHKWGEWTVTKAATETEEGVETRVCKNDSSHKETRAIPKNESVSDSETTTEPIPAPTESEENTETIDFTTADPGVNEFSESEIRKAISKGAAAETATKAITSVRTDKDLKGSVFNKLKVKQSKATKTSITVSWSKVKNAKKYVVYAGKSGKKNKVKKIATLKSTKTKYTLKKFNKQKLTKGTYYKFAVVALDKNGKVITSSKFAHIATKGKNAKSNPAKVTVSSKVKKNKITLKVKKTFKLKGKYASSAKKYKIRKILDIRYESTKPKVAKVSSKGVITAKKKGTCYIYVYAQNGLYKKIKVTVK